SPRLPKQLLRTGRRPSAVRGLPPRRAVSLRRTGVVRERSVHDLLLAALEALVGVVGRLLGGQLDLLGLWLEPGLEDDLVVHRHRDDGADAGGGLFLDPDGEVDRIAGR